MVGQKAKYSVAGMVVGFVIVLGLGLVFGLEFFAALVISVLGFFLGGWGAEQYYHRQHAKRTEREEEESRLA